MSYDKFRTTQGRHLRATISPDGQFEEPHHELGPVIYLINDVTGERTGFSYYAGTLVDRNPEAIGLCLHGGTGECLDQEEANRLSTFGAAIMDASRTYAGVPR